MSESQANPRRVRIERGVYRSSSGTLEVGWTDGAGKQRWRAVKGGIKAARAALAEENAKKARGEAPADHRLRFEKAAEEWEATRMVGPRTMEAYRYALQHLRDHFGKRRLAAIGVGDVARFVAARKAAGAKGWTIRKDLAVLSGVFRYSARLGFAGVNPVQLLDGSERPDTRDAKQQRALSSEELGRLLGAVSEPYRLLFTLAAETGLRLGEVLGLTWADVDTVQHELKVRMQLDRKGNRVPLKTDRSRRTIEVTPSLSASLAAAKLASPHSQPGDLVFMTRRGTPHDHRNVGGRVLARAVKRAGLDGEDAPTFHTLRHSHASRLIADGWDVESVSARLGHASVAITLQAYVHAFDSAARSDERRDRLDALYGDGRPMVGTEGSNGQQTADAPGADVVDLRR